MAYLLIGSSTSVPSSSFSLRLRDTLGAAAIGISGASVASWVRKVAAESNGTYSGKDVLVYLPGQLEVPSVASIQQLQDLLKQKGARTSLWVLPPIFPGDRERITGGTADAILRAGVPLVSRFRMPLSASDVTTDGIHLKAPAQRRLADRVGGDLPGFSTFGPPRMPPALAPLVIAAKDNGATLGFLIFGLLGAGAVVYILSR